MQKRRIQQLWQNQEYRRSITQLSQNQECRKSIHNSETHQRSPRWLMWSIWKHPTTAWADLVVGMSSLLQLLSPKLFSPAKLQLMRHARRERMKKRGTKSFKQKNSFNSIRKHTKTMQQRAGQATPTYGKKICSCKIENRVACRLQLFQSSSSSLINIIIITTTCCCCLGTCIVGSPLLQQQKNRS